MEIKLKITRYFFNKLKITLYQNYEKYNTKIQSNYVYKSYRNS